MVEMRLDELAERAGVPTTTIRLYRQRGLLPAPRLQGRTGWYGHAHLDRLELIARLQRQGFSLAAIAQLIERWEVGGDLSGLLGATPGDQALANILSTSVEVVLTMEELAQRYPLDALEPEAIQRAAAAGLIEMTDDGRFRVPDQRFLDTGAALAHLGVPLGAVIDEWQHLRRLTDEAAARFATLFESHVLDSGWTERVAAGEAQALAAPLVELRALAESVIAAAFDQSIAEVAAQRFSELLDGDS